MKTKTTRASTSIICGLSLILFSLSFVGCNTDKKDISKSERESAEEIPFRFSGNPVSSGDLSVESIKSLANSINFEKLDSDILWALGRCDCTLETNENILRQAINRTGALPQILVPSVREEIINSPALNILNKLPEGGLLSGLAGLFTGRLTSDSAIGEKVKAGIIEKMRLATPGGAPSLSDLAFNYDGFSSMGPQTPGMFTAKDQADRWNYVLSLGSLWRGMSPIGGDHGLQTLHTAKIFSEWEYLFGLKKNADQKPYGGLTVDIEKGLNTSPEVYDPRASGDKKVIFNGTYTISYVDADSVQLATDANEIWAVKQNSVDMKTQATLLHASALAFDRLRPKNRSQTQSLYLNGNSGLLPPDEIHLLPLSFLSGIGKLLNMGVIDEKTRQVRQFATVSGSNPGDSNKLANLETNLRLTRALIFWVKNLEDLSDAGLDPNRTNQLAKAHTDLRRAARALFLNLVRDHFISADGVNSKEFYLVTDQESKNRLSLTQTADLLEVLAYGEEVFRSPLVHQKIKSAFHWFAAVHLSNFSRTVANLSGKDILTIRSALKRYQRFDVNEPSSWYQDVAAAFNTGAI